jgi:hypothetical protein
MKKTILLSFGLLLTALNLTAQNNYFEPNSKGTKQGKLTVTRPSQNKTTAVAEDDSYYYWENNSRHTSELNTLLGTTGEADGGFDTLGLYTYNVKQKPANGGYWQKAVQGIPTRDSLSILGIDFIGVALNPAGSNVTVNVYKNDMTTLLGSKTLNVSTTYGFKSVAFDAPISHDDTMLVVFQMTSVADSFAIAKSHSQWTNFDFGAGPGIYTSSLPFVGDAAVLAVTIGDNDAILGLIQADFDFFVIPKFAYKLKSNFAASATDICLGDSVSFVNSGNTSLVKNPILNYIEWDLLANGSEAAYTFYDFGNTDPIYYTALQEGGVTYATAGTFDVSANTMIWPWTSQTPVNDATNFSIVVTDCSVGLNELNDASVSIYPNPATDNFKVKSQLAAKISLIGMDGKNIETKTANNNTEVNFDLTNLNSGVYFLHVSNANGLSTFKVIKK